MNQLDMKGRHAVVTGGAAGLGYAIAERMIASGARVTLWDRDEAALTRSAAALGAGTRGVRVDVSSHEDVTAAVKATLQNAATIDALVNSAGISGPNVKTWDYPVDEWRKVLEVNLTGLFLCCREVVPVMRKAGYGRIVNIASVAGKDGNPNAPAYSASKAGVIGLTKSLGKELADTGVTQFTRTPIFAQMSEEHIAFMLSKIPMGRFGLPEEIAAMVTWLCTEDCSFSTGAVFDLSGGRSTY